MAENAIEVVIEDREEFEKLTDKGTLYKRNGRDVVATVVGDSEARVNFVYEK